MREREAPNSAASLCLVQGSETSNLVRDLWQTPGGMWPGGTMKQTQTLSALFSFPGFRARSRLQGVFGDPHARLVVLVRRKKLPCAPAVGRSTAPSTTARRAAGIQIPQAGASTWHLSSGGWPARVVRG